MKKFNGRITTIAFCLLIAAAAFLAAAPARAEITGKNYIAAREEMKAMYIVQSLLSWFTRTQG